MRINLSEQVSNLSYSSYLVALHLSLSIFNSSFSVLIMLVYAFIILTLFQLQTDMMDLLGSDLPVESDGGMKFSWSDGILLQVKYSFKIRLSHSSHLRCLQLPALLVSAGPEGRLLGFA